MPPPSFSPSSTSSTASSPASTPPSPARRLHFRRRPRAAHAPRGLAYHLRGLPLAPREGADYVSAIDKCRQVTKRMQDMVETLLVLTRADAGQLSLKTQKIDAADLLDDSWAFFTPAPSSAISTSNGRSPAPSSSNQTPKNFSSFSRISSTTPSLMPMTPAPSASPPMLTRSAFLLRSPTPAAA